jgi:hypothetical protein
MKFRILITMIASVCLTVSGLANAVPITHNNYTLNDSTNIVTHTDGTEWLQWDVTKGISIKDALHIYASDGWVLAGNVQMGALFADFGWFSDPDESVQTSNASPFTDGIDESPMDMFLMLFGNTRENSGYPYGTGTNAFFGIDALYGDDEDGDNFYNLARVLSDRTYLGSGIGGIAFTTSDKFFYSSNSRLSPNSVALVRVKYVPEPSTLAIFALGMIGLASRRFKKQS